jgi:hypothetical protein
VFTVRVSSSSLTSRTTFVESNQNSSHISHRSRPLNILLPPDLLLLLELNRVPDSTSFMPSSSLPCLIGSLVIPWWVHLDMQWTHEKSRHKWSLTVWLKGMGRRQLFKLLVLCDFVLLPFHSSKLIAQGVGRSKFWSPYFSSSLAFVIEHFRLCWHWFLPFRSPVDWYKCQVHEHKGTRFPSIRTTDTTGSSLNKHETRPESFKEVRHEERVRGFLCKIILR